MTDQDVKDLIERPGKVVVLPFAWIVQEGGYVPRVHVFESGVQVGREVLERVTVRARYRGEKIIRRGDAEIIQPESFSCALFLGDARVAALDTNPGQLHTNKVGHGLPHFGQTIDAFTHRHIWTGAYGYAEPVNPPVLDVVRLLEIFAQECRLDFCGQLMHPRKGEQGRLL